MKKGRKIGKLGAGPFAGTTVYMSPQEEIDKYDERLQEMLSECFGIGGALLTDLSTLDDFMPSEEDMEKLRRDYDAQAKESDRLVDVAKRIWG